MHIVTSLFYFFACSSSEELQVSITNSPKIPSVIQITVNATASGTTWITGESNEQIWKTTPQKDQIESQFTILGLHPNSEHQITIHWEDAQGNLKEKMTDISIPPLGEISSAIPLSVDINQGLDGYIFGTIFGDPVHLILLDMQGNILWGIEQGDDDHGGIDSDISPDRSTIYFNQFHKDKSIDDSKLQKINWSGESLGEIRTPLGHHMFDILSDGSIVYIALDLRETEQYGSVCGDQIIKLHPDGTEEVLFSTWDYMTVHESASWPFVLYPFCRDWTHGNFIEWNPERESFLFSMAGTDTIFELSSAGEPIQEITGFSAYAPLWIFEPADGVFSYPHGPHWNQAGELMFISTRQEQSSAVAYNIQEDNEILEQTWSWGEEYGYQAYHLGEVIEIKENRRLINWGSVGVLQILDENDAVLWEVHSGLSQWFAQFEYWDSLPGMEILQEKEN